jgi:hypothetical protein
MMNVMQAIKNTPPSASAEKIAMHVDAEDTAGAEGTESKHTEATEVENLGTTMSEINKLISDVVPEIDIDEVSTSKSLEDTNLDLRHLGC